MDSKKSKKKSNVNFTKIPNCIIESLLAGEVSKLEFKLISLFLYNKNDFKYSCNYLRKYFHPSTLNKLINILIENNFLIRDEVHIDRYRTRVNYSVRPVEEWTYFKQSMIKKESEAEGGQREKMSRKKAPSKSKKMSSILNKKIGSKVNPIMSDSTTFKSVRLNKTTQYNNLLCLNKLKAYNKPPLKQEQPKPDTKKPTSRQRRSGVVVERVYSRNFLSGKIQSLYLYPATRAIDSLVTELRERFSDRDIKRAAEMAEASRDGRIKFYERFQCGHTKLWFEECLKHEERRLMLMESPGFRLEDIFHDTDKEIQLRLIKTDEI